MENFNYYNPVQVLFGKGKIAEIGKFIPKGFKVMLTYGGGSIKQNGVHDQVMQALRGYEVVEFGGIEPNPRYETLMVAVGQVQRENIGFLLAVGGGSVIDGTKFIAAASCFRGKNPWDIVAKGARVDAALSLGTVLTLPATGSEMNCNSVVTREETREKLSFASRHVFPRFSVLDPETTYSLPARQLANGIIDAFVHVMEQYYTFRRGDEIQDRFSEGILKTLIDIAPRLMGDEEPDYQTRATFMWAATVALNGVIGCGVAQDWSSHHIGHELTALHGLDHGVTLAIVLPGVLHATANSRREKLLQYAERVWGIDPARPDAAEQAIEKTENFFRSLGVETRLPAYHVGMETIERVERRLRERGVFALGGIDDVNIDNLREILTSRL
ncbi:MAG: iron-containing alcohol dehydrogenase [Odoribacteraceae bacterium]|jgi:NADP-dependent alcohol dehydrogenase|nr:iron-containing alcohol dehydrogenase [Odoribacteraceae bacterium]